MPSLKKFCNISKFLKQNDKSLYQVLDDLCLLGLFRVRGNGVTFLYPSDAAYRKKIVTKAYSDSPEDAVDMVKALIIKDFLPTPAAFKTKQDDIPNMLHQKIEIDAGKSTEKDVVLKNGNKLTLDSSYKTLRQGDPVAIYKMGGKTEISTNAPKSMGKYMQKTGGNPKSSSVFHDAPERKIAECVESLYMAGNKNVYKAVMAAMYEYAVQNNLQDAVKKHVCPSARASFYCTFAPYSVQKDVAITNAVDASGMADLVTCDTDKAAAFVTSFEKKYNDSLSALVGGVTGSADKLTQAKDLFNEIQTPTDARLKVLKAYGNDRSKLHKDLFTVYCHLSATQEINDDTYYKNCFLYAVKNIFNGTNSFSKAKSDTVYDLSLFYNLVKSDAFMYVPVASPPGGYEDIGTAFPTPSEAKFYTIQGSEVVKTYGGAQFDSSTYFGGVLNSL